MTNEERELLLKDLCARLPYGVIIHTDYKEVKLDRNHCGIGVLYYEHYSDEAKKDCNYDTTNFSIILSGCYYGDNIKPYLRSMSSMTEEEKKEEDNTVFMFLQDFYNEYHFDYRGLIEKGLAIEYNPY